MIASLPVNPILSAFRFSSVSFSLGSFLTLQIQLFALPNKFSFVLLLAKRQCAVNDEDDADKNVRCDNSAICIQSMPFIESFTYSALHYQVLSEHKARCYIQYMFSSVPARPVNAHKSELVSLHTSLVVIQQTSRYREQHIQGGQKSKSESDYH